MVIVPSTQRVTYVHEVTRAGTATRFTEGASAWLAGPFDIRGELRDGLLRDIIIECVCDIAIKAR